MGFTSIESARTNLMPGDGAHVGPEEQPDDNEESSEWEDTTEIVTVGDSITPPELPQAVQSSSTGTIAYLSVLR